MQHGGRTLAALTAATALFGIGHAGSPQPAAAAPPSGVPALAAPMSAAQVIGVLDQAVDWYRTLGQQQQAANEPSDTLFLYDNRLTAGKVLALAFDIGRADAEILGKGVPGAPAAQGDAGIGVSPQALQQFRATLEAQAAAAHAELETDRRESARAGEKSREALGAKIHELEGVLDLVNTKRGILDTMSALNGADGTGADSLRSQIDAMAIALPPAAAPLPPAVTAAATTATSPASPASLPSLPGGGGIAAAAAGRFGLWDLATNVLRLSAKDGTIASVDKSTAELQATLLALRARVIDQIKTLSARGDALAAQAQSADSATLNAVHDQLDALAAEFKESSALLLPLSRAGVLLQQYRRNLANWRGSIDAQYRESVRTLALRLAVVLAILAALFAGAALWRHMVLKYIQDSRRRHQLLLVRRIALWSLVVFVIGMAFASELGSIVTFAGLITAGIAVAMQSVLVSIVGYFFLIGKYGIRVGDRVQIGEVAGEVIDLGLVRMYLMELGAKGAMGPTGRVVAFANSVVFQVSSGLFKQIPGVNFTWREVVLDLPAGADYAALKERLVKAVDAALADYREEFVRQTREIERATLSSSAGDAKPEVQLRFAAGGVEAHVRYPVHLQHAAEIDERVTEAIAGVLAANAVPAGAIVPVRPG